MEVWIRSQDKKRLVKVNDFEYSTEREQITKELKDKKGKPIYYLGRPAEEIVEETIYHCIFVNNLNYGTYSTEEKALKVLDMINEIICEPVRIRKVEYALMPSEDYDIYSSKFFQMPQDDEV